MKFYNYSFVLYLGIFFIGSLSAMKNFSREEMVEYIKTEKGKEYLNNLVQEKQLISLADLYFIDGIDKVYQQVVNELCEQFKNITEEESTAMMYKDEFFSVLYMIIALDRGADEFTNDTLKLLEQVMSCFKNISLDVVNKKSKELQESDIISRVILYNEKDFSCKKKIMLINTFLKHIKVIDKKLYLTWLIHAFYEDRHVSVFLLGPNSEFFWRINTLNDLFIFLKETIDHALLGEIMWSILTDMIDLEIIYNNCTMSSDSMDYLKEQKNRAIRFLFSDNGRELFAREFKKEDSEYKALFIDTVNDLIKTGIDSKLLFIIIQELVINGSKQEVEQVLLKWFIDDIELKKENIKMLFSSQGGVFGIYILCRFGYEDIFKQLINIGVDLHKIGNSNMGKRNLVWSMLGFDILIDELKQALKNLFKWIDKDTKNELLNPSQEEFTSPIFRAFSNKKFCEVILPYLLNEGAFPWVLRIGFFHDEAIRVTVLNDLIQEWHKNPEPTYCDAMKLILNALKKANKIEILNAKDICSPINAALFLREDENFQIPLLLLLYGVEIVISSKKHKYTVISTLERIEDRLEVNKDNTEYPIENQKNNILHCIKALQYFDQKMNYQKFNQFCNVLKGNKKLLLTKEILNKFLESKSNMEKNQIVLKKNSSLKQKKKN